jgi:pimeloyl-ACP methyl ester carboxylesterase
MIDAPQKTKPARLAVPGATLYYKMQGHGPLLLMLQGGDGEADGTDALASHVIDHYTVLSYDRRGLSRSPVDDRSAPVDLSTPCGDAARLFAARLRQVLSEYVSSADNRGDSPADRAKGIEP